MIIASSDMAEVRLTFVERRHEYGDVFTYIFRSKEKISFNAGQYGHVRLFGMPVGVQAVHEFSFASAPHEDAIWFGVDARSGSPYQKRLKELEPGDEVELFKVKGHMPWPPEEYTDVVMIAGGVGITPFRSQLLELAHNTRPITVTVIHASRDGYLYQKELSAIAREYRMVRSDELTDAVHEATVTHPKAMYFIAGSAGFVEIVNGLLHTAGISAIKSDTFKGLAD